MISYYYYDRYSVYTDRMNYRNFRYNYESRSSGSTTGDITGASDFGYTSEDGFWVSGSASLRNDGYCFILINDYTLGIYTMVWAVSGGLLYYNFVTAILDYDTVYRKGSYITTIIAKEGTYPNDGRHYDGYWYVRKDIVCTQIATVKISTPSGVLEIPVLDPTVGIATKQNQLRLSTPNGIGCFYLVPVEDSWATPLRVMTPTGIKAVARIT